jgi:Concanavalin A-like lectin/glucanases superfamily
VPTTPRILLPYPSVNQNPWNAAFVAMANAIDTSLYPIREDRNIIMSGGGTLTFSASTGVLTWSAPINLLASVTGYQWSLPINGSSPGSVTLQDGQLFYITVTRAPQSNGNYIPIVGSFTPNQPNGDNQILIGIRIGSVVHFRDGFLIGDGQSTVVFDNTGGGVVSSGLPTRGLTYSIQASEGMVPAPSFTGIQQIYNQAPAAVGRRFNSQNGSGAAILATGINGNTTLEFGTGCEYSPDASMPPTETGYFYKSSELSIGCVFLYTGSAAINTSDFTQMPLIVGDSSLISAGISVGLVSGQLKVVGWVYDYNASTIKFVESVSVSASVGHYVVMTYSLFTTTISLYVDGLAVATASSVGQPFYISSNTASLNVGASLTALTTTQYVGHILELDGWNVTLTSDEIAQAQSWFQSQSGL